MMDFLIRRQTRGKDWLICAGRVIWHGECGAERQASELRLGITASRDCSMSAKHLCQTYKGGLVWALGHSPPLLLGLPSYFALTT